MKRFLFLSLLFFTEHNLFGMNENFDNNLIKHFNEIFELEELAIEDLVEQLKGAKKLEYKKKSGLSLLQIVAEHHVDFKIYSDQFNAQIKNNGCFLVQRNS